MRPDTFARYAGSNVPRYTSYPTAPVFSAAVGDADYRAWLGGLAPDSRTSLYVHVPFCRSMCLYCGCHTTVTARDEPVDRYLAAVEQELRLVADAAPRDLPVVHLHFGGGTPTLMEPRQMLRLAGLLRKRFAFTADAEVAVEIDPRTFSREMASALGAAGFNRASIGVQCFDPAVQQAINRLQSFEQTGAAVAALREAGIERISFDLIYGLPRQSVRSCLETIDKALRLEPDRFAVFGYAHVPNFKPHQRRIDAETLPGASARLEQSRIISEALADAGYVPVGLDHFARPDDPLALAFRSGELRRNFQGYTTDTADALIGLGASSIGRLPGGYVQNAVLISDYQKRVAAGRLPIVRGYALTGEDRVRGAIIERLMCDRRVDLDAVCAEFGSAPEQVIDPVRLDGLERDGLIERRGLVVEVKEEAFALLRSVAAAFDAHLADTSGRHAQAV
jgi:oxygen-independent coproporphyrinogen III oxidase